MTEEQLAIMHAEVARAIQLHVNGKIDKLTHKLDEHIAQHDVDAGKIADRLDPESDHYLLKDVLPIIEAYKGSKILGEFLKWSASLGIAWMALKGFKP